MRTIDVYFFNELGPETKEKAIEWVKKNKKSELKYLNLTTDESIGKFLSATLLEFYDTGAMYNSPIIRSMKAAQIFRIKN